MENAQFDAITQTFKDTNLNDNFDLEKLFGGLDPDADVARLRRWASGKGVASDAFDKAHRLWRITATLGANPRDVENYVRLFATAHSLTVGFDGSILGDPKLGDRPEAATVETELRLTATKLFLPERIAKAKHISDAWNKYIRQQKDARVREVKANIIVPPVSADDQWQAFAHAIADTDQVSVDYVVAVLKTTAWQVKRKLIADPSYPVTDHLMAILTGPQRAGKSSMARKFFGPLGDLMYCGDFAQITDKSNFEIWRYPLVFCDEMERAERSDIEAVKNAITSATRTGRTLYSNNVSTRRNDTTFFGATNGTLADKIVDTTGLRRFAPIPVKSPPTDENKAAGLPVVDWEAVNAVDYLLLWRSVDYMAAHPLQSDRAAFSEWSALIESERAQDSVEVWLRQFGPEIGETATSWQGKDLYPRYKHFCDDNGYKACAANNLGRKMRSYADARADWFPFARPSATKGVTRWTLKRDTGGAGAILAFTPRPDIAAIVAAAPSFPLLDEQVR